MKDFLWILVDAVALVAIIVAVVRLIGLRSFSKMSAFDFAITVAMGSILASVVLDPKTSFLAGGLGVASLLGVQWAAAQARLSNHTFESVVDNCPLLLMHEGRMLEENLRSARVTHGDLRAKLREANVLALSEVRAVVFETTGDISVLHGEGPFDETLLEGVSRAPRTLLSAGG